MAIGTTAALVGGSIVSSAVGGILGNKAANAQENAAEDSLALQERIYNQTREDFAPYLGAGTNALAALEYDLGLRGDKVRLSSDVKSPGVEAVNRFTVAGGKDFTTRKAAMDYLAKQRESGKLKTLDDFRSGDGTWTIGGKTYRNQKNANNALLDRQLNAQGRQYKVGDRFFTAADKAQRVSDRAYERAGGEFYEGYQKSPGYEFRLGEGVNTLTGSAAARGGLFSGATAKALTKFGQDYATADYQNHLANLFGIARTGVGATGGSASAGANFASGGSNALLAGGDAQAAGYINTGNAINSGINNLAGIYGYGGRQLPMGY